MSAGQFIPILEQNPIAMDVISFVKSIPILIMRKSLGKILLLAKAYAKAGAEGLKGSKILREGKNSLIVPNNKSVIKVRLMILMNLNHWIHPSYPGLYLLGAAKP
jgi:hypothetical protein